MLPVVLPLLLEATGQFGRVPKWRHVPVCHPGSGDRGAAGRGGRGFGHGDRVSARAVRQRRGIGCVSCGSGVGSKSIPALSSAVRPWIQSAENKWVISARTFEKDICNEQDRP